jgi:hypothetical protein
MAHKGTVSAPVVLKGVTQIYRRGIGPVYRGIIPIGQLYRLLKRNLVQYSPRYQRGFKPVEGDLDERLYDDLYPLHLHGLSVELQLDERKAEEMAVKYLLSKLFSSHITWNARREENVPEPEYDEENESLAIESSITIPDSGHRHLAYYKLGLWHEKPSEISDKVIVDQAPIYADEIRGLIAEFNPEDEYLYVEVYVLTPDREGDLYVEFNTDRSSPATAVAQDLNPDKTPSLRFVYKLIGKSLIFARTEIETRRNSIGSGSRKLTTNATLEAAVRPMSKRLLDYEKNEPIYSDLLEFTSAFFEEWANYYKAWRPDASAEERQQLRKESLALSNLILHPLFRIVFRLWEEYKDAKTDWSRSNRWKEVVAKLAGTVEIPNGQDPGTTIRVPVMSRDNMEWQGRVIIDQIVANNRQAREAAYRYLCEVAGIGIESTTKPRRRSRPRNEPTTSEQIGAVVQSKLFN